ncbi:MAG: winged helix-turn-helix domain-containing protein [Nitrososphaera sp.]
MQFYALAIESLARNELVIAMAKWFANIIICYNRSKHGMRKAKRRDREEIIFEILRAARVPTTRTRLIYASFLSGTELKEYIRLLVERKMLQFDELNRKLVITDGGRKYMKIYRDMENAGVIEVPT